MQGVTCEIREVTQTSESVEELFLLKTELPQIPLENSVLVFETEEPDIDPPKYYKVVGIEMGILSKSVLVMVKRHKTLEDYRSNQNG
jgi:hypothetical protein